MAYNDGCNYTSSYFQGSEQDGRSQAPYPDVTNGNGYQRQSYQPMTSAPTAYISAQTSSERTTNNYPPSRYVDLGSSNNGGYNPRAGGHTNPGMNAYHANPRSSIDTTALGNLAYASSLGQDSRHQSTPTRENASLQPISDYNRSQAAATYGESASCGLTSTASNAYDHRRSDSRGAVRSRDNASMRNSPIIHSSQYGNFSANNGYGSQQHQAYSRVDQGVQSSESHVSRFDGGAPMQSARQVSAHPSRPASGQSVHTPQTTQSIQSPHLSAQNLNYPSVNVNQAMSEAREPDLSKQSPQTSVPPRMPTVSNSKRGPSSTPKPSISQPKAKAPRKTPKQVSNAAGNSQPGSTHSASNHHKTTSVSQPQNDQRPTAQGRADGDNSNHTEHSAVQYSTTVDPNQVFNHYEYEKRQAAAAAAAKKNSSAATESIATASPAGISGSSTKDQMELEMKQMIEKMRDYKAKDPDLFSQIWEQVKRGQPSNQASSQVTPSTGPSRTEKASNPESNESVSLQVQTHIQLPQESELSVEPPQQNELDLGKFPAQRRRTKGNRDSSRRTSKIFKSQELVLEINDDDSTELIHSLPPTAPSHPTKIEDSVKLLNGNQSMQVAMKTFNHSLIPQSQFNLQPQPRPAPVEIVYARGIGPSLATPTKSAPKSQLLGGTIWPDTSKLTLAQTAAKALTSSAVNVGKSISVEEIVHLLDQNPSYTALCEVLERRGFIIDRGHFARLLLCVVPGLDSSQKGHDPDHSGQNGTEVNGVINGVNNQGEPVDHHEAMNKHDLPKSKLNRQPKKPKALVNGQTPVTSTKIHDGNEPLQLPPNSFGQFASGLAKKRHLTQEDFAQSQSQFQAQSQSTGELQPTAPTLSKKELARKRSFGELVDLTQELSDEDDAFRREFKARLDKAFGSKMLTNPSVEDSRDNFDSSKARSVSPNAAFENDLRKKLLKNLEGTKSGLSSSDDEGADIFHSRLQPSQRNLLRSASIVRMMDKRHDALRRSTYNPKTIARDVLVAAGKHPTMAPLNYHLDILRKTFRHVEYHSDLGTFRWDLVDPGGPELRGSGGHDVDMNDADDEDAAFDSNGADLLAQRPMIASTASGEMLTSDINPIQSIAAMSRGKRKMPRLSDTGIRRAVAGVTNGHQITPQNFASEDGMMTFSRASDDDMMSGIISYPADGQVHRSPRGRPRKKSKSDVTKTDTPEQDSPSGQRRRGRPPGAKNKNTTKPGNPMMIPTRTKPSGNSVNTPSGLRNAMTPSDGVAIVIGAGSSAVPHSSKERSRHSLSRQPSTPQHKIYRCRWRDCPFELHNLETLRKHVYKHRDQFSHSPFPCLWTNCGTIVISDEKETDDRENLHFENEDDWIEHMNGKHIDHYAWELGDGPSAHPSDAEASDYLSDSRGRQVTPAARASGPSDPIDLSSGRRTARTYHNAHGNLTEADKARAVLEAVQAKKRATGLGIDRGGSTFVTEKMRALVDEGPPGISKVAEEDF